MKRRTTITNCDLVIAAVLFVIVVAAFLITGPEDRNNYYVKDPCSANIFILEQGCIINFHDPDTGNKLGYIYFEWRGEPRYEIFGEMESSKKLPFGETTVLDGLIMFSFEGTRVQVFYYDDNIEDDRDYIDTTKKTIRNNG